LAYTTAENFIKGGNNRVILKTDAIDFNVWKLWNKDMETLIEEKKEKSGVFLTIDTEWELLKTVNGEVLANKEREIMHYRQTFKKPIVFE
jgi:Ca-activated chloride channel family protein